MENAALRNGHVPTGTRHRVVAVAADPEYRGRLLAWLEAEFDLVLLPRGDDLLAQLSELRPEAVIVEVEPAGRSGLELCRRLRDRPETARAPILLIAARDDAPAYLAAVDAGASAFLSKPRATRDELVASLRALLEE